MKLKRIPLFVALLTATALAQTNLVIPKGTEIKVRTDTTIPAKPPANAVYAATISANVTGSSGAVVIPRGTQATLVARTRCSTCRR